MQALINNPNPDVAISSMFCGSGFLAFSNEFEAEMKAGHSPLAFGIRVLFDTNFLSDMPKILSQEMFSRKAEMEATLNHIVEQLEKSFDWSFAALENIREVVKQNNPWPYRKVAAIKLFDAMPSLSAALEANANGHGIDSDKFISAAEEHWRAFLGNEETWKALARRDLIYCLMLKTMILCWSGASTAKTLATLSDFSVRVLGTLPLKELYFAWKCATGFASPEKRLEIFAEAPLRKPSQNSLLRISALAWDFFFFRWCETLLSEHRGPMFVVQAITTLDKGLLDAVRACPLRAVLISDSGSRVEAIFDDELEFQMSLREAMPSDLQREIADPCWAPSKSVSRYLLSKTIHDLETDIQRMTPK